MKRHTQFHGEIFLISKCDSDVGNWIIPEIILMGSPLYNVSWKSLYEFSSTSKYINVFIEW